MRVLIAALLVAATSCGGSSENEFGKAYPPTGNTKTFDLTVQDAVWEVGPNALYNAWTYNGKIPGPQIDVNAGDKVIIRLTNNSTHKASIHTHVVEFEQAQDGTDSPSIAMPGQTVTVEWQATFAGAFPYHDHANEGEGVRRGLIGALIVHAPGEKPATEEVVVLGDLESRAFKQLPGVADPVTGEIAPGEYRGAHQYMHTINGRSYEENIPPFEGKVGHLTRWRVISIGSETHTWHIHGSRWVDGDGRFTDNIQLAPGMYRTFEVTPLKAGDWLVHCHFPDHMEGGMMARFNVSP